MRACLCALLALPVLTAPAAARPAGGDRAHAALDAVAARLLVIRSDLDRATPERRVRLLHEQRVLEARKRKLTQVAAAAAVRATIARREDARRAAEEASSAPAITSQPAAGIVANAIPSSVPVPLVSRALGGELPAALDGYLASKLSPLTGHGAIFVAEAGAVGLDPRLLVAISGAETSFATYVPSQAIHNPFGMGPHIVYPSWSASIGAAARNLGGRIYKGDGRYTIAAIQQRWAPHGAANDPTGLNSNWVRNVGRYYAELGGDPNGLVFTDIAGGVPAVQVAAEHGGGGAPAPLAQGPAVAVPGGDSGIGPQIAQDALAFLGTPYLWGGELPETGFDCSGFMQYLYGRRGVQLPRVAEDQAAVGIPISPERLRAGDAIFFADPTGYIHHEGMYLGGGYFIHAPRTGDVVKISSLYEEYYARQYAGARRY